MQKWRFKLPKLLALDTLAADVRFVLNFSISTYDNKPIGAQQWLGIAYYNSHVTAQIRRPGVRTSTIF